MSKEKMKQLRMEGKKLDLNSCKKYNSIEVGKANAKIYQSIQFGQEGVEMSHMRLNISILEKIA
jgi:hypothetical protein